MALNTLGLTPMIIKINPQFHDIHVNGHPKILD